MDQQICSSILRSSEEVMKNYSKDEDVDESVKSFPIIDKTIVSQLATSLTDLLTYKVSSEAYHRYSVRLQIINTLRDWVRPPLGFDAHQIFFQDDILKNLLQTTIKKNFTKNNINNLNTDNEQIVKLCKSLINLSKTNKYYIPYLKKLIDYVYEIKLSCNDDLLNALLENKDSLELDFSIIEKLYILNAKKFIEDPLINFFVETSNASFENIELTQELSSLLNLISKSPKIFTICSNIMCELFLQLNYSINVINYIKFILEKLKCILDVDKKNLIDFYPIKLRSCVIMMQIESSCHTEKSRECILQMLRDIHDNNSRESLTLLLHYSQWLDDFYSYMSYE